MVAAAIPDRTVIEGRTVSVDSSGSFTDPSGDARSYTAGSSDAGVAGLSVSGTKLSVSRAAKRTATATVRRADPHLALQHCSGYVRVRQRGGRVLDAG